MQKIQKVAELAAVTGEYTLEGPLDTSFAQRGHLSNPLLPRKGVGAENLLLADELSRASDKLKWSRPPEMQKIQKVAELAAVTG